MHRASGNGISWAGDSDVAEDALSSPFSHVADDLERFGGELASLLTQVAQGSEIFENGQAAEASGQEKPRKKSGREQRARNERGVEEKGHPEDNEETDDFYQEALDEFMETVAARPDDTICWENLGKAQRHRILIFCKERGLVATQWPHNDAASGRVVVRSEEGPAPRGGDVKEKNRKR